MGCIEDLEIVDCRHEQSTRFLERNAVFLLVRPVLYLVPDNFHTGSVSQWLIGSTLRRGWPTGEPCSGEPCATENPRVRVIIRRERPPTHGISARRSRA